MALPPGQKAMALASKKVPPKPTFITGKNGARIQVNPNGSRYVIKKAPGTAASSTGPYGIETPDQIEQRVTRMADAAFKRQKDSYAADAAQLRQDAEGRRRSMQEAYAAASRLNSEFGAKTQAGWNTAADTIQGLAGAGTGSVADALRADVATQDQALSRLGLGGTGFDANSQQGVEMYRGGSIPAGSFGRYGGIDNQFFQDSAGALNSRGLQEGLASYRTDIGGIDKDLTKSIRDLTTGRVDYEDKLRSQLLGARADQMELAQKAAADLQDARDAQANLKLDYYKIQQTAQTAADKLAYKQIYDQAMRGYKTAESAALVAQREASAASSSSSAALNAEKRKALAAGKPISGASAASVGTVSDAMKQARIAIGKTGLAVAPRNNPKTGKPLTYRQRLFDYLWALVGDSVPKGQQALLRRQLMAVATNAPRPKPPAASGGLTGGAPARTP